MECDCCVREIFLNFFVHGLFPDGLEGIWAKKTNFNSMGMYKGENGQVTQSTRLTEKLVTYKTWMR